MQINQDPVEGCLAPEKNRRPSVQNTVGRIEHRGKGLTLTGKSVFQVLCFILVFFAGKRSDGATPGKYLNISFLTFPRVLFAVLCVAAPVTYRLGQ